MAEDQGKPEKPGGIYDNPGARAASEFTAYILAGALAGYGLGYFTGHMAPFLIVMLFTGFGLGLWRLFKAL